MTAYNDEEREECVKKIMKYSESMFKRHNEPFDEIRVVTELGSFVARPQGACTLKKRNP